MTMMMMVMMMMFFHACNIVGQSCGVGRVRPPARTQWGRTSLHSRAGLQNSKCTLQGKVAGVHSPRVQLTRSGPRRPIYCEYEFCPGTVLCLFRRPSFTSRFCCNVGAELCGFGFCRGAVLCDSRRPSFTNSPVGRFCDCCSGGAGRAICGTVFLSWPRRPSFTRRHWHINGLLQHIFRDVLLGDVLGLFVNFALKDIVSDAEVSPHTRDAQSLGLPRFLFREECPQRCPSLRTPFFFRVRIRAERSPALASEFATHHEN